MSRRRMASLLSAGLIIGTSLFAATPAAARGQLDVLLEGRSAPKGIATSPGSVFVAQGWFFGARVTCSSTTRPGRIEERQRN